VLLYCTSVTLTDFTSGRIPNQDKPDIIANAFLSEGTDEQLDTVGVGLLAHRERELFYNPCFFFVSD
jgi:hypothetical protein